MSVEKRNAAGDSSVVAGGSIPVSVSVINRSDYPFTLSMVASRYADPSKAVNAPLTNNVPVKTDLVVKLPADFPMSQPYWLQKPPLKGTYTVDDQRMIGVPDLAAAALALGAGALLTGALHEDGLADVAD